jgi:small redox-active disulfide protein 2
MKIEVIGSGCKTCKKLFEITQKAVGEMGLDVKVDYVPDVQRIIAMGLMQSPILVVDGKLAMIGFSSDVEKIKKLIKEKA